MTDSYFSKISPIKYEGTDTKNSLAFRYYDKDRVVLGKTMAEHLRPAVCYWHSFDWGGADVFGAGTFERSWHTAGDEMQCAQAKLKGAFEFFEKLGTPYFSFHDRDVAPECDTLAESHRALDQITESMAAEMQRTGVKLLWGTARLFGHRRFMSGAATNPDPEVFAYAAAQVKKVLETTKELGGENYVLWGGREGYETLLNTDMKRETDQLGRFLNLVAEHKHKIGFKGALLIEPKPKEPTKHQYDFDTATVYAFLQRHGIEKEFKVNLEANHAILSGHSFQHEITYALANDVFGSLDMNRGDTLLGWDTDQFPNDIAETALVLHTLLQGGGFKTGGMMFDCKLRRPSIDPEDLFHAHIGALDTLGRSLLIVEKMINDKVLTDVIDKRYAGWDKELGQKIMKGELSLDQLSELTLSKNLNPTPVSGQQEMLENIVNRYL